MAYYLTPVAELAFNITPYLIDVSVSIVFPDTKNEDPFGKYLILDVKAPKEEETPTLFL